MLKLTRTGECLVETLLTSEGWWIEDITAHLPAIYAKKINQNRSKSIKEDMIKQN